MRYPARPASLTPDDPQPQVALCIWGEAFAASSEPALVPARAGAATSARGARVPQTGHG